MITYLNPLSYETLNIIINNYCENSEYIDIKPIFYTFDFNVDNKNKKMCGEFLPYITFNIKAKNKIKFEESTFYKFCKFLEKCNIIYRVRTKHIPNPKWLTRNSGYYSYTIEYFENIYFGLECIEDLNKKSKVILESIFKTIINSTKVNFG